MHDQLLFGCIGGVVLVEAIARLLTDREVDEGAEVHDEGNHIDTEHSHQDPQTGVKGSEDVERLIELVLDGASVDYVLLVDALVNDEVALVAVKAVVSSADGLIDV